jgi:hypothetical protein
MNVGKTIAFGNSSKVWKTRYSFVPTRYAYLDKKLLSCENFYDSNTQENVVAWRHDEKTSPINNFYNKQFKSALHTSFNKDLSANKLYKSLSLEGTENIKGGTSVFLANSTSQVSQLRDASVGKLKEKGGILYADLGRGTKSTRSNVETVAIIRKATPLFSSEDDPPKYGYDYDETLIKLEVDFISKNFNSSKEFKILLNTNAEEAQSDVLDVAASYDSITARFASPGGFSKGNDFIIVKDTTVAIQTIEEEVITQSYDLNEDGSVTVQDLILLLSVFGTNVGEPNFNPLVDENEDGNIGSSDLMGLLANFGYTNYEPETELQLVELGWTGYYDLLNETIPLMEAEGKLVLAVMATPSEINGRDPKGQYADLALDFGVDGTEDFELDILNLNYEHTRLDHSS